MKVKLAHWTIMNTLPNVQVSRCLFNIKQDQQYTKFVMVDDKMNQRVYHVWSRSAI